MTEPHWATLTSPEWREQLQAKLSPIDGLKVQIEDQGWYHQQHDGCVLLQIRASHFYQPVGPTGRWIQMYHGLHVLAGDLEVMAGRLRTRADDLGIEQPR